MCERLRRRITRCLLCRPPAASFDMCMCIHAVVELPVGVLQSETRHLFSVSLNKKYEIQLQSRIRRIQRRIVVCRDNLITNQETVQNVPTSPALRRRTLLRSQLDSAFFLPSFFVMMYHSPNSKRRVSVRNGPSASCGVQSSSSAAASSTAFWLCRIAKDTPDCITTEHLRTII